MWDRKENKKYMFTVNDVKNFKHIPAMKTLEKLSSKNSEYVDDRFSTLDTKGIELELMGMEREKYLKIILERLNELGELRLYSYQYEMARLLDECNTEKSLQELSDSATNPDDFSSDIPSLKKRIKYCKNLLERKSLERQLNDAYKSMKKRR